MREMTYAACGPRCCNRLEGTQHLSCSGDTPRCARLLQGKPGRSDDFAPMYRAHCAVPARVSERRTRRRRLADPGGWRSRRPAVR